MDNDTEEVNTPLSPEEILLRDLVNLALTIRDDGQVNPLTVVDVSQGVTRLYRIETGERRYWATWLLRDFFSNGGTDGTIPCIVIPNNRASVFRQAKENSARAGLSAIAMARQAALLVLSVHGYEIPNFAVNNDFYRQALELDLRGKREFSEAILAAMGGIDRRRFSQYKSLLKLSDEALELADRYHLDEGVLRFVLLLEPADHGEMVQQIISLGLTVKQVKDICERGGKDGESTGSEGIQPSRQALQLARLMKFRNPVSAEEIASVLVVQEGDRRLARAKVQMLKELVSRVEQFLDAD
jgi:ParB-like chromosome segregation protein Spo0J